MKIYTVTEFNEYLNELLAEQEVAVEGEVSEFKVSQNKWLFFNLKDDSPAGEGILKCFSTVFQIKIPILEDGLKVRVYGYPKIHSKSGNFAFTVLRVEPVGEGALKRAYELLKARLEQEGLFAPERKRVLPKFPRAIGLIASKDSAAYSDFIKILKARWGGLTIRLINVAVQGQEAIPQILAAFDYFNRADLGLDVIALIRGGGSLEDLQAFNSEEVARAVFGSRVPVAAGVGHERDETLADFAADLRCSTPSNVAELIVPHKKEVRRELENAKQRFLNTHQLMLEEKREEVEKLIDRLKAIIEGRIARFSRALVNFFHQVKLWQNNLLQKEIFISTAAFRLESVFRKHLQGLSNRLSFAQKVIAALRPESLLKRGYAIAMKDGKVIKDAETLDIHDEVKITLYKGGFLSQVLKKFG